MSDRPTSATSALRRAAAVAALALAFSAGGCGGEDDGGSAKADPDDIPGDAIATVGDRQIDEDDLDERVAALRRAQPARTGPTREQLEQQAMVVLIQAAALEEEAEQRDVEVTDAEVLQRWTATTEAQFPSKAKLRRFLGRQRRADILYQLRLQALTDKVQDAIRRDDGNAAVEEFQRDFQRRWRDRTACRERYAVASCG